jgi:hypothetical protein
MNFKEEIKYLAESAGEPSQAEWMPKAVVALGKVMDENALSGFLTREEAQVLQQASRYFSVRVFKK